MEVLQAVLTDVLAADGTLARAQRRAQGGDLVAPQALHGEDLLAHQRPAAAEVDAVVGLAGMWVFSGR
ncbi:hypothetical protein ACSRUE_15365 [Sorangium sp. KYC3313]|uniref:hypothetical protein n=1 Tax=Sorangium sp. KYC3313 TaxID=3449740 RepID=UPI003F89EE05